MPQPKGPKPPTDAEKKEMKEIFEKAKPCLSKILSLEHVSLEEWQSCYDMFRKKVNLFTKNSALFRQQLEELMKSFLSKLAQDEAKLSPERKIEHFGECWKRWSKSLTIMKSFLNYISRYAREFDVSVIMHTLWKEHMFSKECKENLVKVVCDIIDESRHGNPARLDIISALVGSVKSMDSAAAPSTSNPAVARGKGRSGESTKLMRGLQDDVLTHSRVYYREESSHLEDKTPADAVKFVKFVCDRENRLIKHYLEFRNSEQIDEALNDALIKEHITYFFKGFKDIVLAGDTEVGRAISELYSRIEQIAELADGFGSIVKESFLQTLKQEKEKGTPSTSFVEIAYNEYERFTSYCKTAFEGHSIFAKACDFSLMEALNDNVYVSSNTTMKETQDLIKYSVAAALLAAYVATFLTVQKPPLSPEEIKKSEDKVMALYKLLKNKEAFQMDFRKGLTRRLLHSQVIDPLAEAETSFLQMVADLGNSDELDKSRHMITDFVNFKSVSERFNEYLNSKSVKEFPIYPMLISAYWGINIRVNALHMTRRMEILFNHFKEFYTRNEKRKTVVILHSLGKGEVFFTTNKRTHSLSGTEYQLVLLSMITCEGVTLKYLSDNCGILLEHVKEQLAFLIKHKLISIQNEEGAPKPELDKPETWLPTSVVKPNLDFTNKMVNIKLLAGRADAKRAAGKRAGASATEGGDPAVVSEEDQDIIFKDFVQRTECYIVRIMKARNNAPILQVFEETASQLAKHFPVNKHIFNSALEKVIDEGIVQRVDRVNLKYLA